MYFLWFLSLASSAVLAQNKASQSVLANIIRRTHSEYDEEIMYYGKRNEYFNVKIFRKNGRLFRLDSYKLFPKMLPNGFELDSLDRISHFGPTKIMYPNGQVYLSCEYKEDKLHGPFMVFYEDGAIKRRAYYKLGYLKRSQCFTPEGVGQMCDPFYQPAQFTGQPGDLLDYLNEKLGSVLDGVRVLTIKATLSINEIGQVVAVSTNVITTPEAKSKIPAMASYAKQIIQNIPQSTPDALNWRPAKNDGIATTSTCVLSVYRHYGALRYDLYFGL